MALQQVMPVVEGGSMGSVGGGAAVNTGHCALLDGLHPCISCPFAETHNPHSGILL